MKIALLQLEVLEKNKAANVAHGLQLAADAAKEHDLLVLPEVWTTGYSLGHLEQDAEPQDSPVLAQLAELARSEQCAILAGSVPMRHADGKVYNTSAAINKNGEIVNLYDKVHLFGLLHEEDFFAPGNNFNAFKSGRNVKRKIIFIWNFIWNSRANKCYNYNAINKCSFSNFTIFISFCSWCNDLCCS